MNDSQATDAAVAGVLGKVPEKMDLAAEIDAAFHGTDQQRLRTALTEQAKRVQELEIALGL